MNRIWVAIIAFFLAAAPASAQLMIYAPTVPPARTGNTGRIHNVAVISAIGTEFELANRHLLGSDTKQLGIRDWKIDEQVVSDLPLRFSSTGN